MDGLKKHEIMNGYAFDEESEGWDIIIEGTIVDQVESTAKANYVYMEFDHKRNGITPTPDNMPIPA